MNIFLRIGKAIEKHRESTEAHRLASHVFSTFKSFGYGWDFDEMQYASKEWHPSRLKFSVGHNHITIIIGNPITYCENFNVIEFTEQESNCVYTVSICNPKDVYNWKVGAITALENLCQDYYDKELRTQLFDKLFSKYPELRMK